MRIEFSARAWMLNAATALVFLPSLDVEAQTFSAQRTEATAISGTSAEEFAASDKSAIQRQLDAMYAKFGRKPTPVGARIPTEHIAGNGAVKSAPTKESDGEAPDSKVENAVAKKEPLEVRKALIRQVAAEDAVAVPVPAAPLTSAAPRRLLQRPTSRAASTARPARRFFPSLFRRRKTAQPAKVQPGQPNLAVQDYLKKLYEKDGREMPPMELNQLPSIDTAQTIPPLPQLNPVAPELELTAPELELTAPELELTAPRPLPRLQVSTPEALPEAQPIQRVSNNPFKRFIQKISPFKRKGRDAKPVAAPPEAIAEQRELEKGTLNPVYNTPQDIQSLVPAEPKAKEPVLNELAPAPLDTFESIPTALPKFKPLVALPEPPKVSPESLPVSPDGELTVPPELGSDVSDKPFGADEPAESLTDPLANPFPSLSEQTADKPDQKIEEEAKPEEKNLEEENPFTGLKLEAPQPAATLTPAAEPKQGSLILPNPDELLPSLSQPEAETAPELKPAPELSPVPELKPEPEPELKPEPELPALPAAAAEAPKLIVRPESKPAPTVPEIEEPQAKLETSDDPHADKRKKIAERSELQGLKGFCPVQLRDERELRDARSQFSAEYDGVSYNFSSATALRKFQAKPYLYAPASGGKDVVLTAAQNERVEGSLNHAVWYRDRLYLFQEAGSMKRFVASPGNFSNQK